MTIHHQLDELPVFRNAVITIGSYDGVHAGHQQILARVCALAKELDGESVLITFDPHPRLVVYPDDNKLKLITTIEEKAILLERFGLDHLVITPFTLEFSQQSPGSYVVDFLMTHFQPKCIVIGYDHRFGKDRKGNIDLLREYREHFGFILEEIPPQTVEDVKVSSTKIRKAIQSGDVRTAGRLLGHPFIITGPVVKGKQLGQTIGFPTANVQIREKTKIIPAEGVYAVWVDTPYGKYQGMLYIGRSLENTNQSIEVNLFDFQGNLYDQIITVTFVDRIRDDIRFNGLDELKTQLAIDKTNTISILSEKAPHSE